MSEPSAPSRVDQAATCPSCGAELSGAVKFCPRCKHTLSTSEDGPSEPIPNLGLIFLVAALALAGFLTFVALFASRFL